jgi:1,4-dihydroxy-2-naphthoate octaprenyltransferase
MTEKAPQPTFFQIWWMAIRPKTLPASTAGVIAGSVLAFRDGTFQPALALAAVIVAMCLQIGSNLANDVFDFERGADSARKFGPLRVTQAGLLTPRQVKAGMFVVFAIATLCGLYLAFHAGWVAVWIGLAAIVSAIAYTGGPFPLAYYGLGDLFVFIFFGVASVAGTYFVQAGSVSPAAWWMSLPVGLIIVAILVVNNLRDIDSDRAAKKHTLAVRLGAGFSRGEYLVCIAAAYISLAGFAAAGIVPAWGLFGWLSLPLAWKNVHIVFTQKDAALNKALAGTGQLSFVFSLLFALGVGLGLVF